MRSACCASAVRLLHRPSAAAPPPRPRRQSIEAEIAQSEHAELQALLKKNFAAEYNELIAVAVRRRNEGVSDQVVRPGTGRALPGDHAREAEIRASGASMPMIDKLAANEVSLFHALGTEGAAFCLKMLGKDDSAGRPRRLPESVRR